MLEDTIRNTACRLDEINPGWASKVDLNKLDFLSPVDCVLGQVYKRVDLGAQAIGKHPDTYGGWGDAFRELGINPDISGKAWEDNLTKNNKLLIELWSKEITSRLD